MSTSSPLLHGLDDPSHTSNLTAYYPEGSLPTPWPLVVASVLVSLVLGTIGFMCAINTWNSPTALKRVRDQKAANMTYMEKLRENRKRYKAQQAEWGLESELETLDNDKNNHDGPTDDAAAPPIPTTPVLSTWQKVRLYGAFFLSSIRALFALATSLSVLATGRGSHAAPSSLFILLLSIQTFLSNRSLARIFNLVLVLDSLFVAVAFLIASFAAGGTSQYGELAIAGGNCPIYAPNCAAEAHLWSEVGCGPYAEWGENPDTSTFRPYGSSGDLNSGSNVVHIIEVVISVFGAVWMLTVLLTIYEARHLVTHSWADLLKPVERYIKGQPGGPKRPRLGFAVTGLISLSGYLGLWVLSILSVAGHVNQEMHTHTASYIDSFGPRVQVPMTNGTGFGVSGNATSWTDCFTITTPSSSDGFWEQWVRQNVQAGLRIAAGI